MPNYYGEVMQAYWGTQHKTWKVRYKAARIIFDDFTSLVMRDCIFRGYAANVKGHPAALIEGRLDLVNISEPSGTLIVTEAGHPPVFKWDAKEILTVSQMIDTVWLLPDGSIMGDRIKEIPTVTGSRNHHNKFTVKWECEWRRAGTLVKKQEVTANHQWNAVRFLLRLRQAQRRNGSIVGEVLTYDDTHGNVVIVRPVTGG